MTQEYKAMHAAKHPDNGTFEGHQEDVYEAYFASGEPVEIDDSVDAELDELLKGVDPEDIELVAIDEEAEEK